MEYTKEVDTYYNVEKREIVKDDEITDLQQRKTNLEAKIVEIDAAITTLQAL